MATFAVPHVGLCPLQRRDDAVQPLAEVGRAEGGKLQRAPPPAPRLGRHAQPAQRVLQQRHQRDRLCARRGGLDDEIEERTDGRLAERLTGQVLHAQSPGREPSGHPARQLAVGRHERRRPAGRLDRLAQDQRDRLGLVLGAGRFQYGDAGQRLRHLPAAGAGPELGPELDHEPVPALGRSRRPHRLAHQRRPGLLRRVGRGSRQRQHVLAPHAQRIEQLLEAELRMLGMVRPDRIPALLVERLVEARQHQGAVRQPGNHAEQLRHRRRAAHDAGDDHGRARARIAQSPCLRQHQLLVMLHLRDQPVLCEVRRPMLGHDRQEPERPFPVVRERLGHQRLHARGIDVLDLHGVHQPGELARELGRLRRGARPALRLGPANDEAGECELTPHVADCRPQLARGVGGEVVHARKRAQVFFRAADDGLDPGQQHRCAARGLEERLLQRARGASGRQHAVWCRRAAAGRAARRPELAARPSATPRRAPSETAGREGRCRCGGRVPRRWPPFALRPAVRRSGAARLPTARRACRHASTRRPCARRRPGRRRSPGSTPG